MPASEKKYEIRIEEGLKPEGKERINNNEQPLSPTSTNDAVATGTHGQHENQYLLRSESERKWFNQNVRERKRVPWKGIIMAWTLLSFGLTFTAFGSLLLAGVVQFQSLDGITPYGLIIFGLLCVIPGAYYVRNSICIGCGNRGYSWEDIPNFE